MRASSRLKYARLALVGSGLAAAGLPQAAWATDQQGATAAAPAAKVDQANEDRVQDIVVTAQRRKERLQDVPIATTVVGADRTVASRITESSQIAESGTQPSDQWQLCSYSENHLARYRHERFRA